MWILSHYKHSGSALPYSWVELSGSPCQIRKSFEILQWHPHFHLPFLLLTRCLSPVHWSAAALLRAEGKRTNSTWLLTLWTRNRKNYIKLICGVIMICFFTQKRCFLGIKIGSGEISESKPSQPRTLIFSVRVSGWNHTSKQSRL